MQIYLLIKNLWACWFDFDRSFVYTNYLIRLEIIKKNDKFRNHATTTFCSKSFIFWSLKVNSMFFFLEMLFMYASEPFKFAHGCAHSEHERMCVVVTNQCSFAAFKVMYIFRLLKRSFHVTCLSPLNTSIKFTERKAALERVNCNYVWARKIFLENFSWSNG